MNVYEHDCTLTGGFEGMQDHEIAILKVNHVDHPVFQRCHRAFLRWIEDHAPSAELRVVRGGRMFKHHYSTVRVRITNHAEAMHYKLRWETPK